ncbi:MAG: hypothetical protein U9R36_01650, partial [Elusimicrobiota bacterium]|nr:hypothetical protein [Elusimicrobiota bacterium]
LKFIKNPDDAFYNFHLDNADYTPINKESNLSLRTNFLTSFIPFTWGNLSLKYKAVSDRQFNQWVPQVDIVGSYGRIVALDIAAGVSDDEDFSPPSMKDYSIGLLLSKPVSRLTRLYAGYNYSVITFDFNFPEPLEIGETVIDNLSISRRDHILITGIVNRIRDDKTMAAYVGYGFNYKKIFSRFSWHYDHLEMGFNIYPEGLLVVHPFLGWHWNF